MARNLVYFQDRNKDEPKQPVEDEYDMLSNYSNLWNKTQVATFFQFLPDIWLHIAWDGVHNS